MRWCEVALGVAAPCGTRVLTVCCACCRPPVAARKLSTNFIYASDLHGVAEFSLTAGRAGGRSSRIASPDPNTRDVHVELADLMGIHSANLEWDRKVRSAQRVCCLRAHADPPCACRRCCALFVMAWATRPPR